MLAAWLADHAKAVTSAFPQLAPAKIVEESLELGSADKEAIAGVLGLVDTTSPAIAPFRECWRRPLGAKRGVTQLWFVPFAAREQLAQRSRVLGGQDWAAIARARDPNSREHMLATRITLRHALSHAVDGAAQPKDWSFELSSYGKPLVSPGLPEVHFCISHTATVSVIAVSQDNPVGIDIEQIACGTDERVIAAFCSARERRSLLRLSGPERQHAFAKIWSLKEAYSKLIGTGLATNFKSLEFEVGSRLELIAYGSRQRPGEVSFDSWLTQTPAGLCQTSIALGANRTERERKGELVCFVVDTVADGNPRPPRLSPGSCDGERLLLT